MVDLCAGKRQQVMKEGTRCSTCRNLVSDEARQVRHNVFGLPRTHCTKCHKPYCHTGGCPIAVAECTLCGVTSCETCNEVSLCDGCSKNFCQCCAFVNEPCRSCHRALCDSCTISIECEDCKMTVCGGCALPTAGHCDLCDSEHCGSGGCHSVQRCSRCEYRWCSECSSGGLEACVYCGEEHCRECGVSCQCCQGSFCSSSGCSIAISCCDRVDMSVVIAKTDLAALVTR
jgi:hypothetical protein